VDRVIVFIDGANLFFSSIDRKLPTNIDFGLFAKTICGKDRKLIRAYFYDAPLKQEENADRYSRQQSFFDSLRRTDYLELVLGRIERGRQKGVDVHLAVDMIKFASSNVMDTAILVSGDSDLVPAVDLVKSIGKHVEVHFFDQCSQLRDVADKFEPLEKKMLTKCKR